MSIVGARTADGWRNDQPEAKYKIGTLVVDGKEWGLIDLQVNGAPAGRGLGSRW